MKVPRLSPLFKYELFNVLRGRWLAIYAILFAGFALALLQFGSEPDKAVVSLMNVVLLVIPMVSVLYASVYWYNSEGFTSLLLTQPMRRTQIYLSRWVAISVALSASFVLGTLVPVALTVGIDGSVLLLLGMGTALTFIFVALGLLTSVLIQDRMKGIGLAFTVWFYFAIVHDGLVFLLLSSLREYPLETPAMALSGINPIDLVRLAFLLSFDFSAMMGYTGMLLQKALSGGLGMVLTVMALSFWLVLPVGLGVRVFRKRDF